LFPFGFESFEEGESTDGVDESDSEFLLLFVDLKTRKTGRGSARRFRFEGKEKDC